jgi:hypothetical protein
MPRVRLDPSLRFSDVVPVWEQALAEKGGRIETDTENETIALIYRLNQYRKVVREESFKGWTDMDRYVVRKGDLCVHIEPRATIDLMSRMTRLDGEPITPRQGQPSKLDEVAKQLIDTDAKVSASDKKLIEEAGKLQPSPDALRIKK